MTARGPCEHSLIIAPYVRIWDLCGQMSKKYSVPRSSGAPVKIYNMTYMTARANLTWLCHVPPPTPIKSEIASPHNTITLSLPHRRRHQGIYRQNMAAGVQKKSGKRAHLILMGIITWSVHQYQAARMVNPNVIPVQGRSPLTGSRKRCMASERGRWQVVFGTTRDGMAVAYALSRFW